jgi:hypothetical protein
MVEEVNDETLDRLEKRIEDLRNWYEQYFLGSRARAPEQEKTSVQYLIRRLANQHVTNTQLKFKLQQLVSKFNSYNQHWSRMMQKLESGTHRRDKFKKKLAGNTVPVTKPTPSRATVKTGLPDDHIDEVYKAFVDAKKQLNQPSNISKEKLAATLKKQAPALQEKYKGRDVRFKVVVEDGKAKLKATLK